MEPCFAWLLSERPKFIPQAKRLTGSRAKGLSYEKRAVRELKRRFPGAPLNYHQWIEYNDGEGNHGYCEPEVYIVLKECVLLFEMKLTGGEGGRQQMEEYYAPLLRMIYQRPVRCLLICKWVTPDTPGPFFATPESFIGGDAPFGTWHWLP